MGVVGKPENLRRRGRRLPPYIERGLRDIGPAGEAAKEIIESNYEEFKGLPIEKIIEKLRKEYNMKI